MILCEAAVNVSSGFLYLEKGGAGRDFGGTTWDTFQEFGCAEIILRGVPFAAFEFDKGQFALRFQISTSLISAAFLMDEFLFWSVISKPNQEPVSLDPSEIMLFKSNLLDNHLGVSLVNVSVQIQRSSFSCTSTFEVNGEFSTSRVYRSSSRSIFIYTESVPEWRYVTTSGWRAEASKSYGRLDEVDSTSIDVEHEVISDIRINQTRGKRRGDVCKSFNVCWNRYGKWSAISVKIGDEMKPFCMCHRNTWYLSIFNISVMKHILRISAIVLLLGAALSSCATAYTACGAYTCVDVETCD